MKPYFDNGTVAIYHADFRDVIPLGFNQIITDPPYNIGFSQYDIYSDDMVDDEYIEMISIFQNKRVALIQYPEEHARLITPALGPALHYSFGTNILDTPR